MSTHKGTSGSAKRKVAAVKKVSDAAMLSKMPSLDTMFAPSQSTALGEYQPHSPQPTDLSEFMHTDMIVQPLPEHSCASAPVAESESFTELNQYASDIGLWEKIDEPMREYRAERGSSECQNADANFNPSCVVFGTESFTRRCSPSYFTRVHTLTGEKIQRSWLCYSISKKMLFCFACKLFGHPAHDNTPFVSGFSNWRKGEERIAAHENGQSHRDSIITLTARKHVSGRIDKGLIQQYESECEYWRALLTRIVSVLRFITERGLALRGSDETICSPNNVNYLGCLELIAEYDVFLSEHIRKHANKGRGHTSYLSSTVCDEFVSIMGKCVLDKIISEIKSAGHFSVSVDSTPDVSNVDQLTFVIRYVLPPGPVERFVHFLPMMQHTGLELATRLLTFLDQHGIDIKDCRGQSYDNASNMSGKYNGMQAIILKKCQWVPPSSHVQHTH